MLKASDVSIVEYEVWESMPESKRYKDNKDDSKVQRWAKQVP